jgi:CCR4-NOT transcription complex subunit 7/8
MSKIKIGEEEKSNSSDEDNESSTNSSSLKSSLNKKSDSKEPSINSKKSEKQTQNNASNIVEVYEDNFVQEMKNLTSLIKEYNYIGMDTEFPGIVYSISDLSDDFYYKSLKLNVDSLKLIQLGITLSNEKGEYPTPYRTWQFNFEFDYTKDKSSQSSMLLLMSSGIDFNKMKKNGINHKKFIELFKNSGLVLNPNIHWISFHGSYDFAYLLSNLLGNSLPKNEKEFTQILGLFFPNHYDIRILVKSKNYLKGSLNKLANYLDVEREGKIHQAGSDSLVTIEVFWRLIKNGIISKEDIIEEKNIIYGILKGKDNKETINYTKINYRANNNININNKININWNNNMNNNMTYMPYGNNMYNMCMNYCYPQNMVNGLYNNLGFNGIQMINSRNNILQYY